MVRFMRLDLKPCQRAPFFGSFDGIVKRPHALDIVAPSGFLLLVDEVQVLAGSVGVHAPEFIAFRAVHWAILPQRAAETE